MHFLISLFLYDQMKIHFIFGIVIKCYVIYAGCSFRRKQHWRTKQFGLAAPYCISSKIPCICKEWIQVALSRLFWVLVYLIWELWVDDYQFSILRSNLIKLRHVWTCPLFKLRSLWKQFLTFLSETFLINAKKTFYEHIQYYSETF